MNSSLHTAQIMCPYCGETLELLIDCSAGNQEYVEDCQICCAPIDIMVEVAPSGELVSLHSKRDSD